MANEWDRVSGTLVCGHKVASGLGVNTPYPGGTIEMQSPFFKELGLDLSPYFQGTLNVSIAPFTFKIIQPELTFKNVEWTDLHPPENFSFSVCRILFKNCRYESLIYYPHPETKKRHFQAPSIIEIIAPFISEIKYGDSLEVEYKASEIIVNNAAK